MMASIAELKQAAAEREAAMLEREATMLRAIAEMLGSSSLVLRRAKTQGRMSQATAEDRSRMVRTRPVARARQGARLAPAVLLARTTRIPWHVEGMVV